MCWSQQLYDAMIHVYNGLNDYTTPMLELLLQLRAALKKSRQLPSKSVSQSVSLPPCAQPSCR